MKVAWGAEWKDWWAQVQFTVLSLLGTHSSFHGARLFDVPGTHKYYGTYLALTLLTNHSIRQAFAYFTFVRSRYLHRAHLLCLNGSQFTYMRLAHLAFMILSYRIYMGLFTLLTWNSLNCT